MNVMMQHSWSIRTASTCCVSPLPTARLKTLEDDLTSLVRRLQAASSVASSTAKTTSTTKSNTSNNNPNKQQHQGDDDRNNHHCAVLHASLSWIESSSQTTQQQQQNSSNHVAQGDNHYNKASSSASSTNASMLSSLTTTFPSPASGVDRHLHISVQQQQQQQFDKRNNHNKKPHSAITTTTTKAQLILCYCKGRGVGGGGVNPSSDNDEYDKITSFSFLLMRGSTNPMLQSIVQWLEHRTGIIVSQRPFPFTSMQIAHCLTSWTRAVAVVLQQQQQQKQQPGSLVEDFEDDTVSATTGFTTATNTLSSTVYCNTSSSTTTNYKKNSGGPIPLELTFAVPEVVASKGLDTITLTVPPMSLWKLCCDIQDRQPVNDTSINDGSSTVNGQNITTIVDETDCIPILKALQCYMMEVFHIDIRSFPLVRVSSSVGMIGCDGRCKIQDEEFLPLVLDDIRTMVRQRLDSASMTLPS